MRAGAGFLFCPEVIARGHKATPPLQVSWLLRAGAWRLLPGSPAQGPGQTRRGCQSLALDVRHGDLAPAPGRAAPPGAVVPGVRGQGHPAAGHGRGPHPAASGRLGDLRRPWQSPEPLPQLSQPQDGGGNAGEIARFFAGPETLTGWTLGRACVALPRLRGFLATLPRPKKFSRAAEIPRALLRVRFSPHGDFWTACPIWAQGGGRWRIG